MFDYFRGTKYMTKLFESSDLYERFCLVKERISQIPDDKIVSGEISDEFFYLDFFIKKAEKINNILNNYNRFSLDNLSEVEELKLSERNDLYYKDIAEEYDTNALVSRHDYIEEVKTINHINDNEVIHSGNYITVPYYVEVDV